MPTLRPPDLFPSLTALVVASAFLSACSGAEFSQSRVYESERSIARITGGLALGLLWGDSSDFDVKVTQPPQFAVDGVTSGIWHVLGRMALYVFDVRHSGEIRYDYALGVEQYTIRRTTRIADGRIEAVTTIDSPMKYVERATLYTTAVESADGTRITNRLTVSTSIGDKCKLIRRIVEKIATEELSGGLVEIETEAKGLFDTGSSTALAKAFVRWYERRR